MVRDRITPGIGVREKKKIQTDAEVGVFQPPFLPGSPSWFLLQDGSRFFVDYVINFTPSRRVLRRCAAQTNRSQRFGSWVGPLGPSNR